MKESSYMSKNEMISYMKLGCLSGEIAEIINFTSNKIWKRKLKTCVTYIDNILVERMKLLSIEQLLSVKRRQKNSHIILRTEDQERIKDVEKEIVMVDIHDIEELAELALNSCLVCKEGDCVNDCRFRLVMHRLGLPVCNADPTDGQCEFRLREVKQ